MPERCPTEPTPAEPYGEPLMLPQNINEMLLRERLAELGHYVTSRTELLGFDQGEEDDDDDDDDDEADVSGDDDDGGVDC